MLNQSKRKKKSISMFMQSKNNKKKISIKVTVIIFFKRAMIFSYA